MANSAQIRVIKNPFFIIQSILCLQAFRARYVTEEGFVRFFNFLFIFRQAVGLVAMTDVEAENV